MTVASTTRKAGPYTGNGVSTAFAFSFKVFATTDISVVKTDALGAETTLVLDSDYSVTLNADQVTNPGGSITHPIIGSPMASPLKLTVVGGVAYNQTTSLPNGGAYNASIVERALDRLTILIQQILELGTRSLKLPASSTANPTLPTPVANQYLGWDGAGTALANLGGPASTPVSAPMQPVVNAVTLAAARTAMGVAESGANSTITSLSGLTSPVAEVRQIQPISASVAGNALTISASALSLEFRSATLTSGAVSFVEGTPANLVISSGSTLGTVNAVQSRIVVLALNNAGTIELAAVNISGGNDLTETGVISTTAEGGAGAADSASVIYSTTARSNVAYRVIGYVESTQATAGTWATAPSTIQGMGGEALAAMSSLGYSQTVQNVAGSRALSVVYYNTTGKPIAVSVSHAVNNIGNAATLTINGLTSFGASAYVASATSSVFGIVPPGGSYSSNVSAGGVLGTWIETR